jgi:dephospho-CoA kinase
MAIVFGLTGGIASGKSTVSTVFAAAGVSVVDGDLVSRDIVRPGEPGLDVIVKTFGAKFLTADGTLDRKALGAHVFGSVSELNRLDTTLGPILFEAIAARVETERKKGCIVCVDAALLIEKGLHRHYRPLVVVAVSPAVQIQRIMARDELSEEAARARIASQLPLMEKVSVADHVIVNEGTRAELEARALEVLAAISSPPAV